MSEKDIIYHKFPNCMNYIDIQNALYDIFEIYEIRANVGKVGSVVMELRMKEEGHNIPHIHAKYGDLNVAISLIDFSVLAGNIPEKNQKKAILWVKENCGVLRKKWNDTHQIFEFPVLGMSEIRKIL